MWACGLQPSACGFRVVAINAANIDVGSADVLAQQRRPIEIVARTAAEKIETERLMLRERMHREMRLGQHADARHAAVPRKLVPLRCAHDVEIEIGDDLVEELGQLLGAGETRGVTPPRVHEPL